MCIHHDCDGEHVYFSSQSVILQICTVSEIVNFLNAYNEIGYTVV